MVRPALRTGAGMIDTATPQESNPTCSVPDWARVLVFSVSMAIVLAAPAVYLVSIGAPGLSDFIGGSNSVYAVDRDGWNVTSPCGVGVESRYYYPKFFSLADALILGLLVCVLVVCRYAWRKAGTLGGLRVVAAIVGGVVVCAAIVTTVLLGVDLWKGFVGFVPHCPPG